VTEIVMSYPPQPGGWPDQQGTWQSQPAGGWQDPASGQPTYDYQAYQPYQAPMMVPSRRTNGMSIAAMVVAIVGLLSSPCYGIPGIAIGLVGAILGHVGHRQAKERGEDGGGMAVAGIAIGWIAVLAGLIALAIYLYFFFWFSNTIDNYNNYYPTPNYT
jgi:hypothetical protein